MDSLRHPVGPLPSSIYWRRRAVVLCLLALAVALIVWAVVSGTSGDKKKDPGGNEGRKPPATITPSSGPSDPPAVTERPGGTGGSDGTGGEDDEGKSGGPGDSAGAGDSEGADGGGSAGSGSAGAGGTSSGSGGNQPARASMPTCTPGGTDITVRTVKNSYEPGEKPRFEVVVSNAGHDACKVDFGQRATVLTVTKASDDQRMWSSGDCPQSTAADLVQVPAKGRTQRSYEWNRERTAPDCATPPSGSGKAGAGTYLVEARVPGLGTARVSFVIKSA